MDNDSLDPPNLRATPLASALVCDVGGGRSVPRVRALMADARKRLTMPPIRRELRLGPRANSARCHLALIFRVWIDTV